MANLYGVANAPGYPLFLGTVGGVNISCPANTNTAVITSAPIIAPSPGYFYVAVWMNAEILFGATVPTSVQFAAAIGAGSGANQTGAAGSFIANTQQQISALTATAVSQVAWQGPGSTVTIYAAPTAQACTVQATGTWCTLMLFRAPDQ